MKKITFYLIAVILLCLPYNKISAQAPYKASIGGMPYYGTFLAIGPSFKFFLNDNVAFQSDILYRATLTGAFIERRIAFALYTVLETNTNFMYQKKLKDKKSSELFGFIGGGINFGINFGFLPVEGCGKFGTNAIFGLEYVYKNIPLAIQIDLRPGYGVLFHPSGEIDVFNTVKTPWSHFDWMFGFTLRYTFKEKNKTR
jgi:hypothetical protein